MQMKEQEWEGEDEMRTEREQCVFCLFPLLSRSLESSTTG